MMVRDVVVLHDADGQEQRRFISQIIHMRCTLLQLELITDSVLKVNFLWANNSTGRLGQQPRGLTISVGIVGDHAGGILEKRESAAALPNC
jgi:hypothetical protein